MATQVVVFSVLLFGTSGVVLDFGRVYSEHSQMQSFTDQAALAAAAELDRKPDSIERAIAAVFDENGDALIPKPAKFSEGEGGEFRISHLFFLSDLSEDSGAQFNLAGDLGGPNLLYTAFSNGGASGGDITVASSHARFVVAVAEERSVRNTLMRLINSAGSNAVRETSLVRTVAAAKRKRVACGALSNIVICNPWEGGESQSFETLAADPDAVGMQFRHVADGAMSDAGALSQPNSLARRLALNGPAAVREICSDPLTLPGADPAMSADEAATAFAICMLASAREEEYCVGDDVAIVAASPEEITTALNTAFDMWDDPIAAVLDWDRDGDGRHSQEVDLAGASLFNPGTAHPLRDESALFQPDLDILKGRIWDEPTAIANTASGIAVASRLNHLKIAQYDDYNLRLNACLRFGDASNCMDRDGEIIDYVSQPTTFGRVADFYASYFPNRFFRDYQLPPFETTSFHRAYLIEREEWLHSRESFTLLSGVAIQAGQSLAEAGEDGSLDTHLGAPDEHIAQIQTRRAFDVAGVPEDANGDGEINALDVEPAYSNFTYNPPYSPIDRSLQRRLINATVVNCGSVSIGDDGSMVKAPVVGFVKLFLLQPPVALCADGTENCRNAELVSSTIHTEFAGESEINDAAYAVLVR